MIWRGCNIKMVCPTSFLKWGVVVIVPEVVSIGNHQSDWETH